MGRTHEHTTRYGGGEGWISDGVFRVTRNSLDYAVAAKKDTFYYERRCLQVLETQVAPTEFIIGPHIIDAMLGLDEVWNSRCRSDAMIFETDHGSWTMKALAEFKSGHVNGLQRKLAGFSQLLSCLRSQPDVLPRKLRYIVGDFHQTPQQILIPADKLIGVIVVSRPEERHGDVKHGRFALRYVSVE